MPEDRKPRSYAAWLAEEVFPLFGSREAVVHGTRRVTFTELGTLIRRTATVLRNAGLGPGATVALASGNRVEAAYVPFAVHLAGARVLSMTPDRGPAECAAVFADAPADALIVDDRIAAECAEALLGSFPGRHCWSLGPSGLGEDLRAACDRLADVDEAGWAGPDTVETALRTGGSTGLVKCALHRHRMYRSMLRHPFLPEPVRFLWVNTLTHVGGLIPLTTLDQGSTIVMLDSHGPETVLTALITERITATNLFPPMLYRLLDHPGTATADLSRLRHLIYGAGPVTVDRLRQALDRFGPILCHLYGLTEALGATLLSPCDHTLDSGRLLGSAGRLHPDAGISIRDEACRSFPQARSAKCASRARRSWPAISAIPTPPRPPSSPETGYGPGTWATRTTRDTSSSPTAEKT